MGDTYMKIIIIGIGKIGYGLAQSLSYQGYDITVIDKNSTVIGKVESTLDVMPIKGDAFSMDTLLTAGCKDADFVITTTGKDEMNMLCCLMAKQLGAKYTIACIREPKHAKEFLLTKTALGIDLIMNPSETLANEIAHLVTLPGVIKLHDFAKGLVRMAGFVVKENMPIVGMSLKSIVSLYNLPISIGAISRNHQLIIPNEDFCLKSEDIIFIFGKPHDVYDFAKVFLPLPCKMQHFITVGGSKITYYLVPLLEEIGIRVKIIEKNPIRCKELTDALPNSLIINGNGTDGILLHGEQLQKADGFIALTDCDEDNIISSIIAQQASVKYIITKTSKNLCPIHTIPLGLEIMLQPQEVLINPILKCIGSPSLENLYYILGDHGEISEWFVTKEDKVIAIPISKLHLIPDVRIAIIVKGNTVVIPTGNDCIEAGDHVILIAKNHIHNFNDIVTSAGGVASEFKNHIKKLRNVISM